MRSTVYMLPPSLPLLRAMKLNTIYEYKFLEFIVINDIKNGIVFEKGFQHPVSFVN